VPFKGLRAIYERHTLNHHQFFTDEEMRFRDHKDWRVTVFPPYALVVFILMSVPMAVILGLLFSPNVGWLFPDPVAAAKDYFKRTGIFPIMHLVGVRRTLAEKHPWLPGAVFKAFEQAKKVAVDQLSDTSATKVTLPFIEERLSEARALMGEDFWSYGVTANRKTLESFLHHHHSQGLSSRLVTVEEMFHPGTLETYKL